MMKRDGARTYLFAAAMRGQPTRAKFTVSGVTGLRHLDVLDENRSVTIADGVFTDDFEPWGVHLYLIAGRKAP
jgi:hypothetical protein